MRIFNLDIDITARRGYYRLILRAGFIRQWLISVFIRHYYYSPSRQYPPRSPGARKIMACARHAISLPKAKYCT